MNDFQKEVAERVAAVPEDKHLCETAASFLRASAASKYSYNFSWQGRPIIQYPQDMVAMQELIWSIKPDLIIETGIAHGGSLILSASMLAMLDMCDAIEAGERWTRRYLAAKCWALTSTSGPTTERRLKPTPWHHAFR